MAPLFLGFWAFICLLTSMSARAEEGRVSVSVTKAEVPWAAVDSFDGRTVIGLLLGRNGDGPSGFCGDHLIGAPPWRATTPAGNRNPVLWDPHTQEQRELRLGRNDLRIEFCSAEREFILLANTKNGKEYFYIHDERVLYGLGEKWFGEMIWASGPTAALAWLPYGGIDTDGVLNTQLREGARIYGMALDHMFIEDWNPETRLLMAINRTPGVMEEIFTGYSVIGLAAGHWKVIRTGHFRLRSGESLRITKYTWIRSTLDNRYFIGIPRNDDRLDEFDRYECRLSVSPDVLLDCDQKDTFPKGCRPDGPNENAVGGLNSERFAVVYCGVSGEEKRLRLFDRELALVSTMEFPVLSPHSSGHVSGSKLLLELEDGRVVLLQIEDDWFQ